MEHFMKMRKKVTSAETTRQVLNKAIDLLHKVSNHKITGEEAKTELSQAFSQYFLSQSTEDGSIHERSKLKLEILLKETYDVVDKLESGRIPLYESIMSMNKVVAGFTNMKDQDEPSDDSEKDLKKGNTVQLRPTRQSESEDDSESFDSGFDYGGVEREKKIHELSKKVSEEKKVVAEAPRSSDINALMAEVVRNKEILNRSVVHLNDALFELGFELKPIEPK